MHNVQEEYYRRYAEHLEARFPFRLHDMEWLYITQSFVIFGGAILVFIILLRKLPFKRTYSLVAGYDVSLCTIVLTTLFAYGFGFVAACEDWWFFFPDLFSGVFWRIGRGAMILGDAIFYPLSALMGHVALLITLRYSDAPRSTITQNALKAAWFLPALAIIVFGVTFGSDVMKGMVFWLYIPFCFAGILTFTRYSAFQLWFPTLVYVSCEFLWDILARIWGVWIFPDAHTHPGLYFPEVTLFHLGRYPIVWQPEMTQMSYISGLISLTFFFLARTFLRGEPFTGFHTSLQPVIGPPSADIVPMTETRENSERYTPGFGNANPPSGVKTAHEKEPTE